MGTMQILDMPDDCLIRIFGHLDLINQCNLANTCPRFGHIYECAFSKRFRCFSWNEPMHSWTTPQVENFFKLNGHKMHMLAVSDVKEGDREPLICKAQQMINVCCYLKNLTSLILSIDYRVTCIIIQICKYMQKLENFVIDCESHPNYEFLVLLPCIRSLDINYYVDPNCKLLQRFAQLRPHALHHLRLGTEIPVEHRGYIAKMRALELLNVYRPCYHFLNSVILQLPNLRVLSISSGHHLRWTDFKHLVIQLKFLSTMYIIQCNQVGDEFILFVVQYLKEEIRQSISCRQLPFYVALYETSVTEGMRENELIKSSDSIIKLVSQSQRTAF
ncbi:uncharacterized protein Dmoj_GI23402 [Drosophila mojavensis]|uniref:F-box domain-containing protein n=1 Tax=Drosophila mojavensis TaxID=7230 RepID=B4K7Y1_DROMO|nr:uncharacterized protein Dmoj_GI23402 [Drosophila mojavensis]